MELTSARRTQACRPQPVRLKVSSRGQSESPRRAPPTDKRTKTLRQSVRLQVPPRNHRLTSFPCAPNEPTARRSPPPTGRPNVATGGASPRAQPVVIPPNASSPRRGERYHYHDSARALLISRRGALAPQHGPPPNTRKNASISASVPTSPSLLKSAPPGKHVGQQFPPTHAKNASISASVPASPSPLKSLVLHTLSGSPPPLDTKKKWYAKPATSSAAPFACRPGTQSRSPVT